MDKPRWQRWLALGAALFGISLVTAVTAGESEEDLEELRKKKAAEEADNTSDDNK